MTNNIQEIKNFENVSLDDVKFMFYQAEKRLDEILKIADLISTKTYTIITIILGFLLAMLGYVFKDLTINKFDEITIVSIFAVIYLIVLIIYTVKNITPYDYQVLGTQPRELINNDFFISEFSKELRTIYFYYAEVEDYQSRIDTNREINKSRWNILTKTVYVLVLLPFVLILLYCVLIATSLLC